ncbi:hypothetical protein [Frigoribacterium salinisoli]
MSDADDRGPVAGSTSTYHRRSDVPPARIEPLCPGPESVDVRLTRLALLGPARYEDFFFPPASWTELEERTSRHRREAAVESARRGEPDQT